MTDAVKWVQLRKDERTAAAGYDLRLPLVCMQGPLSYVSPAGEDSPLIMPDYDLAPSCDVQ
jgi:hypothetical protein